MHTVKRYSVPIFRTAATWCIHWLKPVMYKMRFVAKVSAAKLACWTQNVVPLVMSMKSYRITHIQPSVLRKWRWHVYGRNSMTGLKSITSIRFVSWLKTTKLCIPHVTVVISTIYCCLMWCITVVWWCLILLQAITWICHLLGKFYVVAVHSLFAVLSAVMRSTLRSLKNTYTVFCRVTRL